MNIRPATPADCLAIAELAQMAGDNIPGYFWAASQKPAQSLVEAGAELARSETANFSWRHVLLACRQHDITAMLLAYRLPAAADNDDNPLDFPEFVRPLIELEQCVAESLYINMPALLAEVDRLARAAGCALISIEVFASNEGALATRRSNAGRWSPPTTTRPTMYCCSRARRSATNQSPDGRRTWPAYCTSRSRTLT